MPDVAPQIGIMRSNYNVRSCATELIQNMRVARAMAIKENRDYMITFDTVNNRYMIGHSSVCKTGACDLLDIGNDTFGNCKDTNLDRYPDGDSDANGDGVPDCVRVVNIGECGNNIMYGTYSKKTPGDSDIKCNGKTACFGNTTKPIRAVFKKPDGHAGNIGSVYLKHATREYSYAVIISSTAGMTNMWKWDGDKNNPGKTTWTEMR